MVRDAAPSAIVMDLTMPGISGFDLLDMMRADARLRDIPIVIVSGRDLPIAVNVSPIQFRHHGFATIVGDKLFASGVAPELLRLEITEGVLISHMDAAKSTIRQLRNMGVTVALDDFGTGYSSLSYLENLDFDCMKIDKSFLRDVGHRQLATKVLRSIIELGHSLDLKVVAEGIENAWQARLLTMLNCDYLQGYHYGVAMSVEELIVFRLNPPMIEMIAGPECDAGHAFPETLPLRASA